MIGTILQAGLGIAQTLAGAIKRKPEIPEYDIPAEVYQNMTDAEYWSFIGLPESQKQQFIDESTRAGAAAISRISDRKGGLGAISTIAQQERDDARTLLNADVTARMNNMQNLYTMRNRMAEEKQFAQGVKRDNVMQERLERNELIGAGLQNVMGAVGTADLASAFGDEDSFLGAGGLWDFFGRNKKSTYSKITGVCFRGESIDSDLIA